MNIVQSTILGVVQGLTEFLPISSSAHLVIFSDILKTPTNVIFDLFLHAASLLAVLIYFRKKLLAICRSLFNFVIKKGSQKKEERADLRILLFLIIGSIPAALFGYFFEDIIEQTFQSIKIVGSDLIITALVIFFADRFSQINTKREGLTGPKSLLIGCAQALAIFPGISRSGATISASLFLKIPRKEAAEFSFLLSIPIILGAIVFKLNEITSLGFTFNLATILAGGLASFIASYFAISFFIKLISKHSIKGFAYYCFVLGFLIILVK